MGRGVLIGVLVGATVLSACNGGSPGGAGSASTLAARHTSAPGPAAGPPVVLTAGSPAQSPCAQNFDIDAVTGAHGSASAIGWQGNGQGVTTCLGGSFFAFDGRDRRYGFGIYAGGPTTWVDAGGYRPAQITTFHRAGLTIAITELADRVVLGGRTYVVAYCRVAVTNPTDRAVVADPYPTAGLVPIATAADQVDPHSTAVHDYALAVDRFGHSYAWPPAAALARAGGFDAHFAHMRAFWNGELAKIAAVHLPDRRLDDAYRSGFVYTQIARSGDQLDTGVNGYASEFSHDVIGILANLFTQGYFDDAHALLLEARDVIGSQGQYEDGLWTYTWPWAVYLLKTGDLAFVKAHFATRGPQGSIQPSIEEAAHHIDADRTGPERVIGVTDDIDSNGYWTVDDYEALMGLAAYRYVAHAVGDVVETRWATNEYASLLASTNRVLESTIRHYGLTYLPCSILAPNTANRCGNPQDANWAAPFLFGRWAWDAPLFGAPVSGPAARLVDATYAYGFARLAGKLPAGTFGGYPGDYYSTAYNAGYGSGGLASTHYRDQGIRSYEFMVAHTQSGPYSWWESASSPSASAWTGTHPARGQGSSPHAWGIANANKVLLDSIAAQESDGSLIVGRGVPGSWLAPGTTFSVTNFPTTGRQRVGVTISAAAGTVTLTVTGSPTGAVLFQLPQFVGNVAAASAGTVDEVTGTVRLGAGTRSVTVRLRRAVSTSP